MRKVKNTLAIISMIILLGVIILTPRAIYDLHQSLSDAIMSFVLVGLLFTVPILELYSEIK